MTVSFSQDASRQLLNAGITHGGNARESTPPYLDHVQIVADVAWRLKSVRIVVFPVWVATAHAAPCRGRCFFFQRRSLGLGLCRRGSDPRRPRSTQSGDDLFQARRLRWGNVLELLCQDIAVRTVTALINGHFFAS